jgi:hypothetical protein
MGKKSRRKAQRSPKQKRQLATAQMAVATKVPASLKPSHRRKLDWAQGHIRKAETLIDAWRREGYRVFREAQGISGFTLYAEMLKPLPDDLPLVVGDALHDLRDSLDHIIFAISQKNPAMATPKDEESPQFPIHDAAVDIQDRAIKFLDWHASSEVCDLAPDPDRQPNLQHPLWLLDALNNRDKHREVAFKPLSRPNISSLGIGNAQIDSLEIFGDKTLELGAKPVALLSFRGSLLQAHMAHSASVIFDKGVEVADREVISTLQWFHDHIRDAVFPRLETFI